MLFYSLLDLVARLNKQYIVWQEIFDNGLEVLCRHVLQTLGINSLPCPCVCVVEKGKSCDSMQSVLCLLQHLHWVSMAVHMLVHLDLSKSPCVGYVLMQCEVQAEIHLTPGF